MTLIAECQWLRENPHSCGNTPLHLTCIAGKSVEMLSQFRRVYFARCLRAAPHSRQPQPQCVSSISDTLSLQPHHSDCSAATPLSRSWHKKCRRGQRPMRSRWRSALVTDTDLGVLLPQCPEHTTVRPASSHQGRKQQRNRL